MRFLSRGLLTKKGGFMKRLFLLLALLLLSALLFACHEAASDTAGVSSSPAAESMTSSMSVSTADTGAAGTTTLPDSQTQTAPSASASTVPESTAPASTCEPDTTYEPLSFDLSPIEQEPGTPLLIHWNPYLVSPLFADADPDLQEGMRELIIAVLNRRLSVTLPSEAVAQAVLANFFYEFPPAALTESITAEGSTVRITYRLSRQEHLAALDAFGKTVEEVIASSGVLAGDDDTVKALLLYHYVATHVTYFTVDYDHWQTNAFYALTGGGAICYGFTDAFNYLLRQVGIDAWLVKGYRTFDHAAHGWSLIRLGGSLYYCDATWESSMCEGAAFYYFGQTQSQRAANLTMSDIHIGEGTLAFAPAGVDNPRFSGLNGDKIRNSNWSLDRADHCFFWQGKRYDFGAD